MPNAEFADTMFHDKEGIPNMNNSHDPNEELRKKFMEMFEEYVYSTDDPEEQKRRMKLLEKEKGHMKENPAPRTILYSHQLGERGPNEEFEKEHEKPLHDDLLHDGHDKERIP